MGETHGCRAWDGWFRGGHDSSTSNDGILRGKIFGLAVVYAYRDFVRAFLQLSFEHDRKEEWPNTFSEGVKAQNVWGIRRRF